MSTPSSALRVAPFSSTAASEQPAVTDMAFCRTLSQTVPRACPWLADHRHGPHDRVMALHYGVPSAEGEQFAEPNANQVSTLPGPADHPGSK